jgi:hypothetical protein
MNNDTWPIWGYRILHEVKYEDDKICESSRVQEFEGMRFKISNMWYEAMKTSKSLIKDEGDLNQDDVGWTELLFWGRCTEYLYLNIVQN